MKYTFSTVIATIALLVAGNTYAQDNTNTKTVTTTVTKTEVTDTAGKKTKQQKEFSISNHGVYIGKSDTTAAGKVKKANKRWTNSITMDLGTNFIQDNTNYNDPSVISYLSNVPPSKQNTDLFKLKQSKSINVNLYWLESFKALNKKGQKIIISTGLGMQIYNFRYDNNITYTKDPSTIIQDTLSFSKNKLGLNYLNVPLMFTFKTRLHHSANGKKSTWLVYGAGITGGYNISAWTKQISGERGKVKMHDDFSFNPFNACVTAEIGIDDVIRFYGSYQLTSMYNNGLDQHPVAIGLKLIGI